MLSSREEQILKLVAEGLTNDEISEILFISKTTVITHIYNIRKKLAAKNSCEMIYLAIQKGILPIKNRHK